MDVIGTHAARLPQLDERWTPQRFDRDELVLGLLEGRVAFEEVSHPLDNVLRNIRLLVEGDPDKLFGMSGLDTFTEREILGLVADASGFDIIEHATDGPVPVDPERVLDACAAVGDRLARAVTRGERVILATGHPVGLAHLYTAVGRELAARGVEILTPADGERWHEDGRPHDWWIRYHDHLAVLTDDRAPRHSHAPEAMRRILRAASPDLVFADHGFAGAAIEAGVDTVSIADVNDPALLVAKGQGRTEHVIVMDDNVAADAYWPCFQAIVERLP